MKGSSLLASEQASRVVEERNRVRVRILYLHLLYLLKEIELEIELVPVEPLYYYSGHSLVSASTSRK